MNSNRTAYVLNIFTKVIITKSFFVVVVVEGSLFCSLRLHFFDCIIQKIRLKTGIIAAGNSAWPSQE